MSEIERNEGAQVKKSEREVLIVGKLPANAVADLEAAEYGVPAPPAVAPATPPSPRNGYHPT